MVSEDSLTRFFTLNLRKEWMVTLMYNVIKKDGSLDLYDPGKIVRAISKSSERIGIILSQEQIKNLCDKVEERMARFGEDRVPVAKMHTFVELALDEVSPDVAKSYRDYRNYKKDFVHIMDEVLKLNQNIMYLADHDNANTDSALTSTKRSLLYKKLSKELYQKTFLTPEENSCIRDGYFYIHDLGDRLHCSHNCTVVDLSHLLRDGFEMSNVYYRPCQRLSTAFGIISDVTLSTSSNQYGGFTVANIDQLVSPYADMSYRSYIQEYKDLCDEFNGEYSEIKADKYATNKVRKELYAGAEQLEYKFNTIASSRGDFSFITVTFGLGTDKWSRLMSEALLDTRVRGQGDPRIPVLFPKLVFMTDLKKLHGPGCINEDLYNKAREASNQVMYPDFISLHYTEENQNYLGLVYEKYGKAIAPMGKWKYAAHVKSI